MILGKDQTKAKSMKGTIMMAEHLCTELEKDLLLIRKTLEENGISTISEPYWRLSYDMGRCNEMARICRNELQ